jgi:hypothetical protein
MIQQQSYASHATIPAKAAPDQEDLHAQVADLPCTTTNSTASVFLAVQRAQLLVNKQNAVFAIKTQV